jgi:radical SAM family protein/iron-sulfur cluster protein
MRTLRHGHCEAFPEELIIEINTDFSCRMMDYPHRRTNLNRGPMALSDFQAMIHQIGPWDDVRLTLGGFGEPLNHPDLPAMIHAAHEAGIFGIHIETDGLALHGELAKTLAAGPVDVISVFLDADSDKTYAQTKGQAGFTEVVAQLENFISMAQQYNGPLILCHLTKTAATMDDLEGFYDRWFDRCGGAVIAGFNTYSGQITDHELANMAPPGRGPCKHPNREMMILANGKPARCRQDFTGNTLGDPANIATADLMKLWDHPAFETLRQTHRHRQWDTVSLCDRCNQWFRD